MKRFTIIAALLCAIFLIGCNGTKGETIRQLPECKYVITDADYKYVICKLVTISYWCETMRHDLCQYDEDLYVSAVDPAHDCLDCKLRALKFFYEHEDWADTSGETGEADDFETLLNTNPEFLQLWNSIEL